jgi:hypothetical protein
MTLRGRILLGLLVAAIVIMVGVKVFFKGEVQAAASIIFATLVMAVNLWEWFWPDIIKLIAKTGMEPRKLILLSLLAIAIGTMLGMHFLFPGEIQAIASIIFAVLVMALNGWEWFRPETGEQAEANSVILRRIILLIMAAIAFGMMVIVSVKRPGKTVEFLCTIYAIPVIVVNLWEYLKTYLGASKLLTWRRKILLGLLAAAALIGTTNAYWPDVWLEYAFLVFTVPVALANGLEWFDPESMEKMVQMFGKITISARKTKHVE